jgi:hypothetical protein
MEAVDEVRDDVRDRELSRLIERRAESNPDPDETEPGYVESVQRHNACRREENRQAWAAFHEGQAASLRQTLENLIVEHERKATELLRGAT